MGICGKRSKKGKQVATALDQSPNSSPSRSASTGSSTAPDTASAAALAQSACDILNSTENSHVVEPIVRLYGISVTLFRGRVASIAANPPGALRETFTEIHPTLGDALSKLGEQTTDYKDPRSRSSKGSVGAAARTLLDRFKGRPSVYTSQTVTSSPRRAYSASASPPMPSIDGLMAGPSGSGVSVKDFASTSWGQSG